MTVLGDPSVAELIDLIAAKDFEMAALEKSFVDYAPTWAPKDPTGLGKWNDDFQALQARYKTARDAGEMVIDVSKFNPMPNTTINAKTQWDAIIASLTQEPGLQTIHDRFIAAGAPAVNMTGMPQPKKGNDLDLSVLKVAQDTTAPFIVGGLDPTKPGVGTFPLQEVLLVVGGIVLVAVVGPPVLSMLPLILARKHT